jgi:hypothetical protein
MAKSDTARAVMRFENAILGLQVGHYEAVSGVCDSARDKFWAAIRTACSQIRLVGQIEATLASLEDESMLAQDHYFALYSEVLDASECKSL